MEEARRLARENIKDIIACGFDAANTFIFTDIGHFGGGGGGSENSAFYCNALRVMRRAPRRALSRAPGSATPPNAAPALRGLSGTGGLADFKQT